MLFGKNFKVLFDCWKTDNAILGEFPSVSEKRIWISQAALKAAKENYEEG